MTMPKSELFSELSKYTQPSSKLYDPDFTEQIRKAAPDLLDDTAAKKAELLRLVRSGQFGAAAAVAAAVAAKKAELLRLARSGPDVARTPSKDLRHQALLMHDKGMSSDAVGQKLGVPRQAVAAWIAHRTMGTYGKDW